MNKMMTELKDILTELEKWNEKYNKCAEKYLSIAHIRGHWSINNDVEDKKRFIDIVMIDGKMVDMEKKTREFR